MVLQGDYSDDAPGCLAAANRFYLQSREHKQVAVLLLWDQLVWVISTWLITMLFCQPLLTQQTALQTGIGKAFLQQQLSQPCDMDIVFHFIGSAHLLSLFLPFSLSSPFSLCNTTGSDLSLMMGLGWYPFNGHIHLCMLHNLQLASCTERSWTSRQSN